MGKIFDARLEGFSFTDKPKAKRGRRTIDAGWLSANRDALLSMFAFGWPEIGWQLAQAKIRDELTLALQPLRDHTNRQYIHRLLRETSAKGDEQVIRKKRLSLGAAVEEMRTAQSHCSDCTNRCRDIEAALSQATEDQRLTLLPEFSKRRTVCQAAQDRSRRTNETQRSLENDVMDEEAAYAQDQFLTFIRKGKYAFHPLNLANAVAGLPWAIEVPFMGTWQSYARCSKVKAPGWPHYRYEVFKTIKVAWEQVSSSSLELIIEAFEKRIKSLPRIVNHNHPQIRPQKVDNYTRTFLCENWWYLQLAIKKSLEPSDDPRPPYFVIASNLDKLLEGPRTHADSAIAETARIRD